MNKKRGFTLIEVLTVIMIIAILASVVLVSLEAARNRTKDVTIQNQIGQLRSLAETLYTFEEGYKDFRIAKEGNNDESSKYDLVEEKIASMEGELKVEFTSGDKEYCAYSKLVRDNTQAFCVDSTGNATTDTLLNIQENCTNDGVNATCEGTTSAPECVVDADCGGIMQCVGGVCQ